MAGTLETSTEQSVHHYSERCALYRTTEVFPLLFLKLSTWFFWNPCVIGIGMKNGNGVEGCHKQSLSRRISGKTPFEVESGKKRRPENDDFSDKMWGSGDERRPVREPRKDVKWRETSGFGEGRSSLKSRRCEIWGEWGFDDWGKRGNQKRHGNWILWRWRSFCVEKSTPSMARDRSPA